MLFERRHPILPIDVEFPDCEQFRAVELRTQYLLEVISGAAGASDDVAAGVFARAFRGLHDHVCERGSEDCVATPLSDHLFNRAVGEYERALAERIPEIAASFFGNGPLKSALTPFLSNASHSREDGADILLCATIGIFHSAFGLGSGRRFIPTPVRHVYRAFDRMELVDDDIVGDFGGGVGCTSLLGSRDYPGRFLNLEISDQLHEIAQRMFHLANPDGRMEAHQIDFLKDPLPRVTKLFCYEPVDAQHAPLMVERAYAAGVSLACCYTPYHDIRDVTDAFLHSKRFVLDRERSQADIAIFRARP